MKANSNQSNFNDDRQREHLRQQERLKAMGVSSEKTQMISADLMIENLLKDSFKRAPQTPAPNNHSNQSNAEIPVWLQCESTSLPPQYKYFWSLVQTSGDMADTQKVSQLLLTSGLQVDMLGFIWNLANKTIPGQLTKQEFYIVLALVSLVQNGYTFSNINILKQVAVPTIPFLQVGLQKYPIQQPYVPPVTDSVNVKCFEDFSPTQNKTVLNDIKNLRDNNGMNLTVTEKNMQINTKENVSQGVGNNQNLLPALMEQPRGQESHFPCIGSSPTAELEDDFSAFQSVSVEKNVEAKKNLQDDVGDDFTEFQSAIMEQKDPFETVVISQKREIPKIPLPKAFSGKSTSLKSGIIKISPESEKKLKVLSPAESLSSLPESKISTTNKVSTSLSVLGSNHGIGSRLANHSLGSKLERPKCHKHHKIKINPIPTTQSSTEDEIILGVKPRNLESVIPKCRPKNTNARSFILKETKIRSDETSEQIPDELVDSSILKNNTRQVEIPMLGTFNETVLPTQVKVSTSAVDLISVQEDKYSALRGIELELNKSEHTPTKDSGDDFGDFLSANIPTPNVPQASSSFLEVLPANSEPTKVEEKSDWGDWNFSSDTSLPIMNMTVLHDPLSSNPPDDLKLSSNKSDKDLLGSFSLLDLNDEFINQPAQSEPKILEPIDLLYTEAKEENISEMKVEKSEDILSKPFETSIKATDDEFWDFVSSDVKTASTDDFNRHDSLPSLDLKIAPTSESDQETVWKKCLESCHNLIQEGYEIFHSINTKSVLDEVFGAPKTEDYLNYLNIVFQISKRVTQNYDNIPPVQEEVERFWGRLQDLCFEYNIRLKHDEDNCFEGKIRCNICLRRIGYNVINQGTSSYHPSCANLWINCVEANLPFSI